jgi:hypothetical protein
LMTWVIAQLIVSLIMSTLRLTYSSSKVPK